MPCHGELGRGWGHAGCDQWSSRRPLPPEFHGGAMGLKRAWVFDCDAACTWQLIVHGADYREARAEALDRDWETVFRDTGDSGPVQVLWYCPMHRWVEIDTIPDEDHEAWCPRITRRGGCVCEVSRRGPHTYDDAYVLPEKHGKGGIEIVKPDPELGEIL